MAEYSYDYFNVTTLAPYVAQVEINRPQKSNAFIEVMWQNLAIIFRRSSHDPEVRCVILTAAGDRAFTAGLDVQAASQDSVLSNSTGQDPARASNALRRHIKEFQDCITAIEKCEKPVIAVSHGICYGLALDICTAADIRLCASDTRFSVKEVDIGSAADIGTLTRLPKAGLPMSFVKDVCSTAREFGAEEARRVGSVSGMAGSKEEVLQMAKGIAETIAAKSPVAVLGTKEVLNFSRDHSVEDGLNYVAVWNAAYSQTKDVTSAMTAGLQRRKPTFEKS